jgi:hypothetical protein
VGLSIFSVSFFIEVLSIFYTSHHLASLEENQFSSQSQLVQPTSDIDPHFVAIDDLDSGLDDGEYISTELHNPSLVTPSAFEDGEIFVYDSADSFLISQDHFAFEGKPPSDEDQSTMCVLSLSHLYTF